MAKYEVVVDKETCIACGVCYSLDPNHYESGNEGKSEVKGGEVEEGISEGSFDDNKKDEAKEAARACPVNAIEVK